MSNKKRILFCLMNMNVGGISKACVDLANSLSPFFDIDVLFFSDKGYYCNFLNDSISVIEVPKKLKILGLSQSETKKMGFAWYCIRGFCSFFSKFFTNKLIYKSLFNSYCLKKQYDVAIAYSQNGSKRMLYGGIPQFVLKCVKSKTKIAYIHDDFQRKEYHTKTNINIYNQFNYICTLSSDLKSYLSKYFDGNKLICFPNIINPSNILDLSTNPSFSFQGNPKKVIFTTIARFGSEKGLIRGIEAFSSIDKTKFEWHLIGDGKMRKKIIRSIHLNGLDKNVYLYGSLNNPYPIFKFTDYYLMCSYHEAFPVVIDESHAFGVRVASTQYISYNSQLLETDFVSENNLSGLKQMIDNLVFLGKQEKDVKSLNELKRRNEQTINSYFSFLSSL